MDAKLIFPLIALIGMAIICIVIKSLDKSVEKLQKGEDIKESGCANAGCLIGIILVAIGFIGINILDCSNSSSHYHQDINIEQPIHRDR